MNYDSIWFCNVCRKNSLQINEYQLSLFERYVAELLSWNEKINLISRRDEDAVWLRHILPSVSVLFSCQLAGQVSILDLGTGGGLPGIPLAIALPGTRFTLLDAITKKMNAVRQILDSVQLGDVSIVNGRAEEVGKKPEFRHAFEYVICRAVGPVIDLLKWSKPFLAGSSNDAGKLLGKGTLIMMKGGELDAEMDSARKKFPGIQLDMRPIIVDGIEPGLLSDKKLIIAKFSPHETRS